MTAGDGRESHVFGTMHSQDRRVTGLPPQVRLALAQSRRLVMEIIPDENANRVFSEAIYYTDGTRLNELLHRDIYQTLVQKLPAYGVAAEHALHLKPWAAFTLIGRPRPVRAQTQDEVLMQLAAGKAIAGLEEMKELVVTLDGMAMSDQITILNDTVCNHADILRDTRKLVDLYVARDLAGMVNFNEQPHHDEAVFNRYMQRIVYDRNRRTLKRMEKYLRAGGAFISVGAMHLAGEKGLLRMLEKKGFKITLVY
ncbi:MAG: TraB/GumN family protein [Gammaproteobacteria bacterium]